MDIIDLIPYGMTNAISQNALATLCGTDRRTIRKAVELARRQGAPICSDNSGYYFPADTEEARHYVRMQKHRIRTAAAVLKPVEKFIHEHPEE